MTSLIHRPDEARRIGQLKRWLAKPPKSAQRLDLISRAGQEESVLDSWDRGAVTPDLAAPIVADIQEHADELGQSVECQLRWHDADGAPSTTRTLKSAPSDPTWTGDYDGSTVAQARQAQRHHEAMARLYVEAHGATVSQLVDLVKALGAREAATARRADDIRQDRDEIAAIVAELHAGAPEEDAKWQEQAMQLVQMLVASGVNGPKPGAS